MIILWCLTLNIFFSSNADAGFDAVIGHIEDIIMGKTANIYNSPSVKFGQESIDYSKNWFFFKPYEWHTDQCKTNCVCVAGWLAVCLSTHCAWQKLKPLALWANFSSRHFHACHVYRHHWLWPFFTSFSDLDCGHKVSEKQNLIIQFLAHFSSNQGEIWCDVEAVCFELPRGANSARPPPICESIRRWANHSQ